MNSPVANNHRSLPAFLTGSSEMQQRIRNLDWSQSAAGPIETWPQSLRTTLSIILSSKFPMFLFWGPEHICFYNDAYRPSFGKEGEGKHPGALGSKGADVFPEIWEMVGPQIKGVMETGEANWYEDVLIPMYRNGSIEEVYWTYSMSPVVDERNMVAGVFIACNETAVKVHNQKALAESEARFRRLFESNIIGIFTWNLDGLVTDANDAFLRMTGYSRQDMKEGRIRWDDMTPPEWQAITQKGLDELDTLGYFNPFEKEFYCKDGSRVHVALGGTFYADSRAEGIAYILDISERKRAEAVLRASEVLLQQQVAERTKDLAEANESLLQTNRELLRSNQNLEEFAHAASHDLKEPIRKIHFFTNQLKEQLSSSLGEHETRLFNRIENATQRMGVLVDDLLLYSHVSQRPIEKESVDLNVKVNRVLEDLELDVQETHAVIHVGALPTIQGYRRQLQQLFQNLISNALKYTRPGEAPQIEITAHDAEKAGRQYRCISVSDKGIGFEQEYAEKIFGMFTRLHGKSEYSGTGVGLSIVKKVVENHDGFIEVESAPGEGATFRVYLPAV